MRLEGETSVAPVYIFCTKYICTLLSVELSRTYQDSDLFNVNFCSFRTRSFGVISNCETASPSTGGAKTFIFAHIVHAQIVQKADGLLAGTLTKLSPLLSV